ncbi:hypothetical protein L5515_004623 [Caenorhabditis briggsae]|uniref:Uncharacterized protein n=1 Tax=Caenorhabditis briggsae TaxID=6238 RepID=A0AAE9DE04_CAEBR|nr:hypothetical protein L3Y34_001783 [Caenorhabditis briggsae]UMM24356.1 hypothetical protein L5515_004623 [Caenorhabditis briggsae]
MVTLTNVYTEIFKHRKMFSKENLLMLWCFLMIIDLFLEYYLVKMNMMFYIIAGIVYTILIGCIKLESLKGLRFFRALTLVCLYITVGMLVIMLIFSLTSGHSFNMMVTELSINVTLMAALSIQYILIHEHIYSLELVPAMQILSFGPARPVEQVASVSFTPSSAASLASTTLQHSPAPSTLSPMHTSITFSNSNFSL